MLSSHDPDPILVAGGSPAETMTAAEDVSGWTGWVELETGRNQQDQLDAVPDATAGEHEGDLVMHDLFLTPCMIDGSTTEWALTSPA